MLSSATSSSCCALPPGASNPFCGTAPGYTSSCLLVVLSWYVSTAAIGVTHAASSELPGLHWLAAYSPTEQPMKFHPVNTWAKPRTVSCV